MAQTTLLQKSDVLASYCSATIRLLLFDYDGTLTPIVNDAAAAILHHDQLECLAKLASQPGNVVWVISGRDQQFLHTQLGGRSRIGLVAEHGAFMRRPASNGQWESLAAEADLNWKTIVRQAFGEFIGRFPGSFIEEKQVAIVLHYRGVEGQASAEGDALGVKTALQKLLEHAPVDLMTGKCVLEARPANTDKGQIVQKIISELGQDIGDAPDFCLCVGDDVTDEDMFRVLHASSLKPEAVFTVSVGEHDKVTGAKFHLESPATVSAIIEALAM